MSSHEHVLASKSGTAGEQEVTVVENQDLAERWKKIEMAFQEQRERLPTSPMRPSISIFASPSHIQDGVVRLIDARDRKPPSFDLVFKLQEDLWEKLLEGMNEQQEKSSFRPSILRYDAVDKTGQVKDIPFATSFECTIGEVRLEISSGQEPGGTMRVRSSDGIVRLTIPADAGSVLAQADTILRHDLGIDSGLSRPGIEEQAEAAQRALAWSNKEDDTEANKGRVAEHRQVTSHSFAFVDPTRTERMEERSPFCFFHQAHPSQLPVVVRAGELAGSHERFQRGFLHEGSTALEDARYGGADGVYTRVIPEHHGGGKSKDPLELSGQANRFEGGTIWAGRSYLVIDPEEAGRLDWYAYEKDEFGSREPNRFRDRLPAESILDTQLTGEGDIGNEQIWHGGISLKRIKAIAFRYPAWRLRIGEVLGEQADSEPILRQAIEEASPEDLMELIRKHPMFTDVAAEFSSLAEKEPDARLEALSAFKTAGIQDVNGIPVERFCRYALYKTDLVALAHGRPLETSRKQKEEAQRLERGPNFADVFEADGKYSGSNMNILLTQWGQESINHAVVVGLQVLENAPERFKEATVCFLCAILERKFPTNEEAWNRSRALLKSIRIEPRRFPTEASDYLRWNASWDVKALLD